MAKMIPNTLSNPDRSSAEYDVFMLLRDAAGTEDWVVMHSLNLTTRDKKPFGEVDFVLLVPGCGVFALEIKGGGVSVNEGEWVSTDRKGQRWPLKRSPFKQAQEGMWELRSCLTKALGEQKMGRVVFGSAAWFPDTSFSSSSPEWAAWEVLDRRATGAKAIPALKLMMSQHAARLGVSGSVFSHALVNEARQVLRPDFEAVMAASATLEHAERQLIQLTEEQYRALDILEFNDRLLCEGAAGTGKTMLALEVARREARRGKRVLLLCFNRLLGQWLAEQTADESNLTAGSFHGLGRELIMAHKLCPDFNQLVGSNGFWEDRFPVLAWEAVASEGQSFDTLIVDEAQDLCADLVLDALDAWVSGGLAVGRYAFFADFQRQAIFGGSERRTGLVRRLVGHTRWELHTNCRNTKRIARETALLSGFAKPPYRMGQFDGLPVDSTFYSSDAEAGTKLAARVTDFLAAGGHPQDLVVLSSSKLANSIAATVERGNGFLLVDANDQPPARSRLPVIRFATVQAFKGMESQAIILCDVSSLGDGEPQSILYVGMSRARLRLTLILPSSLRTAYDECRARQFSTDWK